MEFNHVPVLLQECLDGWNIKPDGIYLDGTAGGGGHSSEIAPAADHRPSLPLDQDPTPLRQPVHGWPGFRPR